jgi:hypothetical protein
MELPLKRFLKELWVAFGLNLVMEDKKTSDMIFDLRARLNRENPTWNNKAPRKFGPAAPGRKPTSLPRTSFNGTGKISAAADVDGVSFPRYLR